MKTLAHTSTPPSTLLPSVSARPSLRRAFLWTCIAGFAIGSGATAHAATSTWINTAGGSWNWSDGTNWSLSTPADGVGSTAWLTADITASGTISLDSSRTLGALYIGDPSSGSIYTLTATNGSTLTVDNGGTGAQISQTSKGKLSVINAPILMNDELTISNAATLSGATMTLSGSISSTGGTRNLITQANGTGSGTGITISGAINNAGTITNNGTGKGTVLLSGSIGSNVTDVIQNSSTSALDITGTNSFTGNLEILSGTVILGNNAKGAGDNTIILGSGAADATLWSAHSGGATYTNAISVEAGSGARTIDNAAGNTRTFTGNITLANDLTVKARGTGGLNYSFTLSGNISGTGNINLINTSGTNPFVLSGSSINNVGTITSTGTCVTATAISGAIGSNVTKITQDGICGLVLSGSNTAFAGSVEVVSGFLKTGGTNALNSNNAVAVGTSGTFDINNYAVTIAGLNDGVGAGTVTNSGASAKVLTLGGTGDYSFGGVITAATPANLAVTKTGAGTQTFTGANTYTGTTTINGGTLQLGDGTSGHDGSVAGDITNNSALVYKLSGSQTYGRNITGTGSVTKSGVGALTLSGSNSYIGATNVNGGKLIVSGSLSATTSLSVANGAELNVNGMINSASTLSLAGKLSGSGSVGAVTVNSGGTLSPGNGTGSLTLSTTSLALKDGGTFQLDLNSIETGVAGTNWGKVAVSGALDLTNLTSFTLSLQTVDNSGVVSSLAAWDPNVNHTWSSVVTFGSLVGTFESSDFTVDTTNFVGDTSGGSFTLVQNGNALDLQYQAVPEPSTWASCIGGLGMLIMFRQYRKRMSA